MPVQRLHASVGIVCHQYGSIVAAGGDKNQSTGLENEPLVSIGLPVYNGENFVGEAIQCVLDQTFSNWELVISDNNSTDRTVSICRSYASRDSRIRLHTSARNMGASFNFNEVFRLSNGRYFKWMAHDDLFSSQFVEKCVRELERDENIVLVFPKMCYVDAVGRPLRQQSIELSVLGATAELRAKKLMTLATQGMDYIWLAYGVVRRDIIAQSGAFGLYAGDDQVLLFNIALHGGIKQLEEEMFFRREHPNASTCRRGSTVRERAKGAYADDTRRLVLPWCRLLKEHIKCLLNSPIPPLGKLRCVITILRRFLALWKFFVEEAMHSPLDALRSK